MYYRSYERNRKCKILPVYASKWCQVHAIFQNSFYFLHKLTANVFPANKIFYQEHCSVEELRFAIYGERVFLFPFYFILFICLAYFCIYINIRKFSIWLISHNFTMFKSYLSSEPSLGKLTKKYIFVCLVENQDRMGLICSVSVLCVISVQLSDYCQYCGI